MTLDEKKPLLINQNIEILFEDSWLLIVNKPSGVPTQSTLDPKRPHLYGILQQTKTWPYLGLHHRLDAPTSGIVLFTKKQDANKGVGELFQNHILKKKYLCLVHKRPSKDEFEIKNCLKAFKVKNGKMKMRSTHSGGDVAHTFFKVMESFGEKAALVEAQPQTGRMHQIRVHLAENQTPILGDSLYFRADRHFPRLMLHASEISFPHPKTSELMNIKAPLPDDFKQAMDYLKRKCAETIENIT